MIQVDRAAVPVPEEYLSERTRQERERVIAELREIASEEDRASGTGFFSKVRQTAASGRIRGRGLFLGDYVHLLWAAAQPALMELFHGKCAYCESSGEHARLEVDLFRPRENARDADGSSSPLHYSWLGYDWENTVLACNFCQRAKGSRFPVFGKRLALGAEVGEGPDAEYPMLLNPCLDAPLQHLWLQEDGRLLPRDEAGRATIEVLNLNRYDLAEARASGWRSATGVVRNCLRDGGVARHELVAGLREELDPRQPFLLARSVAAFLTLSREAPDLLNDPELSHLLRHGTPPLLSEIPGMSGSAPVEPQDSGTEIRLAAPAPAANPPSADPIVLAMAQVESGKRVWEEERTRQQGYSIEADSAASKAAYFTSAKRIEHFTIRNFKAIEDISLPFPAPDANSESWLMLLGENGCGKSSILQALALALMGEEHANRLGLDARRFVRRDSGVHGGEVIVDVSGVGQIRMEFTKDSPQFRIHPPDPKVLLLGYGATRLLPRAAGRASSDQVAIRILNLFDPTAPLADTEAWLLDTERVNDEQLERFGEDLTRLLMLPEDARIYRDTGQIECEYKGSRKVLRDMSDGFQSIIALAGDISIGVQDWWGGLRDAEGIVLLDEIEVHLHPTWKISIVERLRQTCPMLSFVVSTHDPLCLKGLRPDEIVVLRRTPENEVEIVTDIPRIDHLRSDQLLSSFLFNLESTRGSGTGVAIARYATLLGKQERSASEEEELAQLRQSMRAELSSTMTPMQRHIEERVLATMSPEAIETDDSPERLEILRQLYDVLGTTEREPA